MPKRNLHAPNMKARAARLNLLVLERRDPACNMARYYVLSLDESLFGDIALVREWGRLGHRPRRRVELHATSDKAEEALEHWLARKKRRGYSVSSVN